MPIFRNFQTNFSGGLLSEGMLGRVDLAQYENGCKQLNNWWPKVTGGMRRRPGSLYLNVISTAVRLESFIFNEDQTYIVAFCTGGDDVRIFDPDTGALVDSFQIATMTETMIRELSVTQKGDVMFYTHETFGIGKIVRLTASTFEWQQWDFEGTGPTNVYPKKMPFVKFAPSESTISVNGFAKGLSVTVTASEPVFTDRHISHAIRYRGKQIFISSVPGPIQPQSTCTGVVEEELDRGAVLSFNSTDDSPNDFEVGEIVVGRDSGVKAEVISTLDNSITVAMIAGKFAPLTSEQIEGLSTGNIATITANATINPPASADWDEEAFSIELGWPSVIEFHSQRLWLGGSSSLPAHIFGSRVAAFFNYDVGDAFPADSIQVALTGKQINQVTDIVSGRHLQVFTDKGEFYAPQSEDLPLVPETFDLIPQTRYGSRTTLEPKVFDESTIFVQAQGSAVREFIWQDRQRGYSADAISLIAEEHLNDIQEVEILYGGYDRPEQIAFFVNGDGTITWYHSARAESIRTWGTWTTNGSFKSLTVVQDKLFALVERTTKNGLELFLERFELDVTLDCAVQLTDTEQSIWPDAVNARWEGIEMQVTTGVTAPDPDYFIGKYTPYADGILEADGVVDITPYSRDNITVGLGFDQTLEIMPIEVKDRDGVTGGMPKRIVSADIYMASTLAIQLEGHKVLTFLGEDDLTIKPDPITGLRKFYLLGYDERPTLTIYNDIPVPCEALSIGAEVEY